MIRIILLSLITSIILITPACDEPEILCVTDGCSGEICRDETSPPVNTTCDWKPEYSCFELTQCEQQSNGKCGWTQTSEYIACYEDATATGKAYDDVSY